MFKSLQDPLSLAGRAILAWFFIYTGALGKITGFAGTVGFAKSVGLPLPELGIALALAIELLGGIALLIGLGTRWAALILAFFTLVATLFFHAYWAAPADQQFIAQLLFNKNIAVIGGLLAFAAFGAGTWSLDAKRGEATGTSRRPELAAQR